MFNFDYAISEWRKQMRAAGIKETASLDELEEHLRSDVEQQTRSGVDAETAFSNAVSRIGAAARVGEEFTKARPRTGASFERWISAGAALLIVATLAACEMAFSAVHMAIGDQVIAFAGIGVILIVACGWRYALPHIPVVPSKARRVWLFAVCFVLAFACPGFVITHVESWLNPSGNAFVAALPWMVLPMPVLICLAQALMMDRGARQHWGMIVQQSHAARCSDQSL